MNTIKSQDDIDIPVSMYQYVDPLSLPRCEPADLAETATPLSVYVEQPGIEQKRFRYAPEFIDDPDETGNITVLNDSAYNFRPNFIVTAPKSALLGYRTILSEDKFFPDQSYDTKAEQYLDKLGKLDAFPNEDTMLRRVENSSVFMLDSKTKLKRKLEGTVISLASEEPSNYGSFLFRILPKISALRRLNLQDLPILVWINNNKAFINLLTASGVSPDKIIHHNTLILTEADRIIVPSLRNPNAFLDSLSLNFYDEMISRFGSSMVLGKRIYISRLSHGKTVGNARVMLNEAELLQRLVSIGVEIFEPEKHTYIEQIQAFSSAEMIIGPSGAGMFNAVFCRPGTKIIDIESEPHWIYAHSGLFASKNLRYGIFNGKTLETDTRPVHQNWTVNIDALIDRIQTFI